MDKKCMLALGAAAVAGLFLLKSRSSSGAASFGLGSCCGPQYSFLGQTYGPEYGLGQTYSRKRYGFGEVIAPAASQGAVMTTDALGGAFYSGNVNLPRGTGDQPDFMNNVVGRSDLSAIPDFMR